jgi:hypothetical protein
MSEFLVLQSRLQHSLLLAATARPYTTKRVGITASDKVFEFV